MIHAVWHWFLHWTGSDNVSGPWYGFWSGFGSDLGEVTLLGLAVGVVKSRNCHVKGCWRLGKHPVSGTPFAVCRRHHPELEHRHIRAEHVHAAHKRARQAAATPRPRRPNG